MRCSVPIFGSLVRPPVVLSSVKNKFTIVDRFPRLSFGISFLVRSKVNIESSVKINTVSLSVTTDPCTVIKNLYALQVQENSPAQQGGLEPFFDFIIAIGHTRLVSILFLFLFFFLPCIKHKAWLL